MTQATEIQAEFGNVSIGDQTVRIGVKIAREAITLEDAESTFCGSRIWGVVSLAEPGDAEQTRLPGMEDNVPPAIEGVFETKQLGVRPNEFSVGLNFNRESIDVGELCRFAKKTGTVTIHSVKDIDDPKPESESEHAEPIDEESREAYSEGCEAATAGKARRCPYKQGDDRRNYWLRGFDDTQVSGADMRQCVSCQTDYDGNEYEACPECESEHFVRLESSEAE